MEFLLDPGIWVSLLTLIILEIVLGIDNLVFIAILAEKLPPEQRNKARVIGLSLALLMRLGLLFIITWLVTLTRPLITVLDWTFSGRDLILLFGGLFLVYKAVTELHEKIEGKPEVKLTTNVVYAGFTAVVAQIGQLVNVRFAKFQSPCHRWKDRTKALAVAAGITNLQLASNFLLMVRQR